MTTYWDEGDYDERDEDDYDVDSDGVPWSYGMTTGPNHLKFAASCPECGFTSHDVSLLNNHRCEVQQNGGHCEDYPACGHEWGDCNGLKYGSDQSIKDTYYELAKRGLDDHEIDMYFDQMNGDY